MKEKTQIVHIHGGMAFNSYESYLYVLNNELDISFDHPADQSRWSKNYYRYCSKNDFEVIAPTMPQKDNAKYSEWVIWFEKLFPFLRGEVILVGHSLGATFLAKYLSEHSFPLAIKQLHLIAGVFDYEDEIEQLGDFGLSKNHTLNEGSKVKEIHLYHSPDDFIVPFSELEKFSELYPHAVAHILDQEGHVLGETFPELFEVIEKSL